MIWVGWLIITFVGFIALMTVLFGVLVMVDKFNERRWKHEKRKSGSGNH